MIYKIKNIFNNKKESLYNIEVQIVDHCNLNCYGCTHYSTLAKENFIDINNFKNDIEELSKKIDLNKFRIMGGEPLLHPNIINFLEESRKYLPNTKICLVTNGILLPKMNIEFWNALRNNNIQIDITKYPPLNDNFSKYLDLCDEYGVKIGDIHVANKFWFIFNPSGDSDLLQTFNNCTQKNCKNLRNGKLYHCPTSLYIDFYNKYFNKNIPVSPGIDIYSNSSKEIINFFNTPIETCKFCVDQSKPWHLQTWKKTTYNENEWNY
ncbi:radical SAM protein [Brachyspira intermedia]|uniref:radical SAM protein n=1 Tax=Brachyspira intermedia TaxID=84377 RepID=UPI00260A13E0|nr:radical SAM protein [uncultured Brachyspira sp.]